jgi:hypothetical protein
MQLKTKDLAGRLQLQYQSGDKKCPADAKSDTSPPLSSYQRKKPEKLSRTFNSTERRTAKGFSNVRVVTVR